MAKKRQPGRPEKLATPAARARVLDIIRKSRSLYGACVKAGLSYQTLRNRCASDPDFAAAVDEAQQFMDSKRRADAEALVWGHAPEDAPTARWLLARLDHETYGDKPEQHLHAHAHVVANDPVFLPPEQRRVILVSLMGQPAGALIEATEASVVESTASEIGDGTVVGADAKELAKVLPASTVAKANGHSGNGQH